jgi:hypothetical protein
MTAIPRQVKNISGLTFSRLTVTGFVETRKIGTGYAAYWSCRCECGTVLTVNGTSLRTGNTRSCGCLGSEITRARNFKHGAAPRAVKSPEYTARWNMLSRCYNPANQHFDRYGGRGIAVCDRWRFGENALTGFECFLADIGPRPDKNYSVDRYPDPDGNYEPGNVRWATQSQQVRNSTNATKIKLDGNSMSISDAAEAAKVPYRLLQGRLRRGWGVDKSISVEKNPGAVYLTVHGERLSLAEAAKITPGVTQGAIQRRLRRGMSEEDAVLTPRMRSGPKPRTIRA